jgi:hypothetical protein
VSFLPARGAVGERRVDQAEEVVAVVTAVMAMIAAVPAVPSATAVSGPRCDQDGQDGENEEELAAHTDLRSPEAARRGCSLAGQLQAGAQRGFGGAGGRAGGRRGGRAGFGTGGAGTGVVFWRCTSRHLRPTWTPSRFHRAERALDAHSGQRPKLVPLPDSV